jgi:hypothetical protein
MTDIQGDHVAQTAADPGLLFTLGFVQARTARVSKPKPKRRFIWLQFLRTIVSRNRNVKQFLWGN